MRIVFIYTRARGPRARSSRPASARPPSDAPCSRRSAAGDRQLHRRRAARARAPARAAARPRDDLSHARAPARERRRPPAARGGPARLCALPPGAPPPSRLHVLRRRRGDGAVRGAVGGGAARAARLPADRRTSSTSTAPAGAVRVTSWAAGARLGRARDGRCSDRSPGGARRARGSRASLATAIALTGGIVVAVALFQVLPEAIEALDDPQLLGLLVGAGFVFFFVAERALVLHHRDDAEHIHAHAQVGALGAAGLSLHSFIDGLGIGLAFGLSTETGLLVFLAVVAHDFADGLNTVGFVLRQSGDRRRAIRWLVVDAIAPLAGRDRRLDPLDLGGEPRRAAGRVRRLLPLHGRHRPAPPCARAPLRPPRAPHPRRLRRHARNQPHRWPLNRCARELLRPRSGRLQGSSRSGSAHADPHLRGNVRATCGRTRGSARGPRRRAQRLVLPEAGVGRDLLGDGRDLARDRGAVLRVAEEELDPGLGAVVGRHVVVDEELAELHRRRGCRRRCGTRGCGAASRRGARSPDRPPGSARRCCRSARRRAGARSPRSPSWRGRIRGGLPRAPGELGGDGEQEARANSRRSVVLGQRGRDLDADGGAGDRATTPSTSAVRQRTLP